MKRYSAEQISKIIAEDIGRLTNLSDDEVQKIASETGKQVAKALRKDAMQPGDGEVLHVAHEGYSGNGGSVLFRQFEAAGAVIHNTDRLDQIAQESIAAVRHSGNTPDITVPQGPMERMRASGGPSQATNERELQRSALFGPLVKSGGIFAGAGSSGAEQRLAKTVSKASGATFNKGQQVIHRFTKAVGVIVDSNSAFSEVAYSEDDVAVHLTAALRAL